MRNDAPPRLSIGRAAWWRITPFILVEHQECGDRVIERSWSLRYLEMTATILRGDKTRPEPPDGGLWFWVNERWVSREEVHSEFGWENDN